MDYRNGSREYLSQSDILQIMMTTKSYVRKGGRTALLFSDNLNFGLVRMIESNAKNQYFDFQIASLRDSDSAINWLDGSPLSELTP